MKTTPVHINKHILSSSETADSLITCILHFTLVSKPTGLGQMTYVNIVITHCSKQLGLAFCNHPGKIEICISILVCYEISPFLSALYCIIN